MLHAEKAQRTVQYVLAIVRQIYNYATDHHLYNGDNPSTKVKRPKFDNRRSEFFSEEQAADLLKKLSTRSQDLHDMALLYLTNEIEDKNIIMEVTCTVNNNEIIFDELDELNGYYGTVTYLAEIGTPII